jgi:predicted acyl esterase
VLDWVVEQPWCSGRVALFGQSYDACAALHTASAGHPAVTAVVAINPFLDLFTAISAPGGVPQNQFLQHWSGIIHAFDAQKVGRLPQQGAGMRLLTRGVARALPAEELPHGGAAGQRSSGSSSGEKQPSWWARRVARGRRRALLRDAVAQHAANWDPRADGPHLAFIDDVAPSASVSPEACSLGALLPLLAAARVPVYWTSAWYDATVASACAGFAATRDTPGTELLIGPWTHMLWQQVITSPNGGGPHGRLSAFSMPAETLRYMLARFAAAEATGSPRASTTTASMAAFEAAAKAEATLAAAAAQLAPAGDDDAAGAVPVSPQPPAPPAPWAPPSPSPMKAPPSSGSRVRFFELGMGRWVMRPDWPPVAPSVAAAASYSLQRGALAAPPAPVVGFADCVPPAPLASGRDALRVRLDAHPTGVSRWQAMLTVGRMVRYDMSRLPLRYDGPPLAAPLRVAGSPVLTLWLDSSDGLGDIFAYVLDVDPSGKAHYVTEGCFRAMHRAEPEGGAAALGPLGGAAMPQHAPAVPVHTFRRADAAPLPRDGAAPARVCFALMPTAYVFAARHRVALALSGSDVTHFTPEAGTEARTLGVSWGPDTPSTLSLPKLRDGEATHRGGHRERAGDQEDESSCSDSSSKGSEVALAAVAAQPC